MFLEFHPGLDLIGNLIKGTHFRKIFLLQIIWNGCNALLAIESNLCFLNDLFIQVSSINLDIAKGYMAGKSHHK